MLENKSAGLGPNKKSDFITKDIWGQKCFFSLFQRSLIYFNVPKSFLIISLIHEINKSLLLFNFEKCLSVILIITHIDCWDLLEHELELLVDILEG